LHGNSRSGGTIGAQPVPSSIRALLRGQSAVMSR
jgi:hypothetical protein